MNNKTSIPLPERLKNGAKKLGEFWKNEKERCPSGWSLEPCVCQPMKKFCQARVLWLTLAVETGRDLEDGPFGLACALTASEWDATKLALKVSHPDAGEFKVGASNDCAMSMVDMAKLMDMPQVLGSTLRVLRVFPRSSIQETLMSETPAPALQEADPEEASE